MEFLHGTFTKVFILKFPVIADLDKNEASVHARLDTPALARTLSFSYIEPGHDLDEIMLGNSWCRLGY